MTAQERNHLDEISRSGSTAERKCMHCWTPDMVRFMEDAGNRTDFYRMAAEELASLVGPESFVCDVGCGLGFSSLELARRFRTVRAVDLSGSALAVLRKNSRFENLEILQADAFALTPLRPYDAMLFCCCGGVRDIVAAARRQCQGAVLVIQKETKYHRLTAGRMESRRTSFGQMEEEFSRLGIPFRSVRRPVRIDQPLRSIEDGIRFFRTYDKNEDLSHITAAYVEERVLPQEDPEFPYCYPMETEMGFLSFFTKDLPAQREDGGKQAVPNREERQALLQRFGTPANAAAHGEAVARCALELAWQAGAEVDRELLAAACELHDLARGAEDHAAAGARFLEQAGYPAVARLVAVHHDLPETAGPEACLLYLADKLIKGEERVSLEKRFRASREKCSTPEAVAAWQRRYARAREIGEQYGLQLDEGEV